IEGARGATRCPAPSHPTACDRISSPEPATFVTGTGTSHSHSASLRGVGHPRNYLQSSQHGPSQDPYRQHTAPLSPGKVTNGGGPALRPVVQLDVPPYAITNPIWIDADGKPGITPLRLP